MDEQNRLSEEDLERVRSVTSSGYNTTERKPFRGLVLLAVLWGVIAILGGVSWVIGKNAGYL